MKTKILLIALSVLSFISCNCTTRQKEKDATSNVEKQEQVMHITPQDVSEARGYNELIPYQIQGKAFYLAVLKNRIYAILDNRGKELFRIDDRHFTYFRDFYDDRRYDDDIMDYDAANGTYQGYSCIGEANVFFIMVYDDTKGFGVFEKIDRNPYSEDTQWEKYIQWENEEEDRIYSITKHPKILWTGIKIPDYSTAFLISIEKDFQPAEIIDLFEIAGK